MMGKKQLCMSDSSEGRSALCGDLFITAIRLTPRKKNIAAQQFAFMMFRNVRRVRRSHVNKIN
jgi:hypothetical protein